MVLLRNLLFNQLGFIVSITTAFFLSPYVVHTLGDSLYGIWSLIMSLTGHYGLLTFGIQGATTRHIAYSAGKGDYERMNAYINSALRMLLPAAGLCVLVGALFASFMEQLFDIDPAHIFDAKLACFMVSITIGITFAFVIFSCVLSAFQRFDTINLIRTGILLFRTFMTVLMLSRGYAILGLAVMGLLADLLNGLLFMFAAKFQCPHWKLASRYANWQTLKELLAYGVKSLTGQMALTLIYQCDLFVIGIFLAPEQITIYSLGATLLFYIVQFTNAIVYVFDPYATQLYARGGMAALRPFYLQGSRFIYALAGVIVAGCLSFGKPFFTLWIDAAHVESAVILWLLVMQQLFGIGTRFGNCILVATGRIGKVNAVIVSGGLIKILLSVIFIQFWGIRGVAVSTVLPMFIIDAIWFIPYLARLIEAPARQIYVKSVGSGLLLLSVGAALGRLTTTFLPPDSWGMLLLDIGLMLTGCGLCALVILPERIGEVAWKEMALTKVKSLIMPK